MNEDTDQEWLEWWEWFFENYPEPEPTETEQADDTED